MAGILKYWRESATLILASKRLPPLQSKQNVINKLFKTSPDLAVVDQEEALRILLMKRNSSSKFMPDTFVFPGGMLDNSDFSKDWVKYLNVNNKTNEFFSKGIEGSQIFSRQRDAEFSFISGEVALRLAAIRETFEESGILLARPASEIESRNLISEDNHPVASSIHSISNEKVANKWREKIMKDSSQFLVMCREMEVVPDIWSLYEWSNWLTPLLRSSRFDTAFFLACIDEAPGISPNEGEMDCGLFVTPFSMLNAAMAQKLVLAPPQLYELSRLIRLDNVDDLLTLAWRKSAYRTSQWMPVIYKCADGVMFCLPGDDLYPDEPDLTGESSDGQFQKSESFAELQQKYPGQHRAFISQEKNVFVLYCNIDFTDGHILPISFNDSSHLKQAS